ncbi:MAG: class I SAM-dependent methyltransferase [Reichenbachiella sp.]|uniref:class I SAM-dependent methyltransferase n=1 Tax=Reichenbachiella sp. TaxID=2184521 RepID=UPI00326404F0
MTLKEYTDKSWYDYAYENIESISKEKKDFTVFDIGAGNSILREKVEGLSGTWRGFDYEPRHSDVQQLNMDQPLSENETAFKGARPDIIVFLEVLEHLFNPGIAIENIGKMAKSGTYLIFSTPNPFWSPIRLKFFVQGIFPMFRKSDMLDNHHVYTAWPHVTERLLEINGFEVKKSCTLGFKANFPGFQFHPIYFARIIVFFIRKILETGLSKSKGMSYAIVAQKK